MQIQRVETKRIVARGSDGNLYDLYRIMHQSRAQTLAPNGPWTDIRVEWLTSFGAIVSTDDEWLFRLGDIMMVETVD